MHKMVNGKKVELGLEEETAVLHEWFQNKMRHQEEVEKIKEARKREESLKRKMRDLGFGDEEIDHFLNKKPIIEGGN